MTDAPVRRLLAALTIAAISLASMLPVPRCATHDVGATAVADAGAAHEHAAHEHAAHQDDASDPRSTDEVDARARIPAPPPMPCGGPCAPASCIVVHGLAACGHDAGIAERRLVASAPSRAPAIGVAGPARAPEPPPPRG